VDDVRRALPECAIAVVARSSIAPLFTLVRSVDQVVSEESLAGGSFDAALLLPNSFRSAYVAWRAGIAERWGCSTDWRRPLLTRVASAENRLHQAARYQHLVRSLGFANGPGKPRIEVSEDVRRAGAELLRSAGWDGMRTLVALAPGAAYGGAKRWPAGSFAAVGADLAGNGCSVVLVGSAGDAAVGADVELAAGRRFVNVIGRTDLPLLAGVLANCRALVTNDSGAMHFGAALGIAVTAMFGPTDERETRPIGTPEPTVLTHAVWCRPCMLRECPIDHRCMRGISVAEVLSAVRRTL